MQVGTPLLAPAGHGMLERDITYYFLRSSPLTKKVLLVTYVRPPRVLATLIQIDRDRFEEGLLKRLIVEEKATSGLPPHLEELEGTNWEAVDTDRLNARRSHRERVERRLFAIQPLLEKESEILDALNPERSINEHVKAAGGKGNGQRIRTWFFTYLCFGRHMWTLFPTFHRNGRWDRLGKPGPKLGRPPRARGQHAGYRLMQEDIDKIISSYNKFAQEGKSLEAIYHQAMISYFKAEVTTDDRGSARLLPTIVPVPTYDQYRYQLRKKLGGDAIALRLYGHSRFRRTLAEYTGTYASNVGNVYEVAEADAYYCEDLPRAYLDHSETPALAVVRLVDVVSGMRLGIGFSLGNEDSVGYRAMLFSAAISKKKFCSLFGIEIEEQDWPCIGLPLRYITDRGPGIKLEPGAVDPQLKHLFRPIREMAVSGSGQSKSIVESAQRRVVNREGPASKRLSDMSVVTMAKREIRRLILENRTANTKSRMLPEMYAANLLPTPLNVWSFMDERARSNAQPIGFSDAVRVFLREEEVTVKRSGVHLRHQLYDSDALRKTGLLKEVGRLGTLKLRGYVYPFSVRVIWVEVFGQIVEVEAKANIRSEEEQFIRTFDELEAEHRRHKDLMIEHDENKRAASVEVIASFERDTGKSWHSKKTRSARTPKVTSSEAAIAKDIF